MMMLMMVIRASAGFKWRRPKELSARGQREQSTTSFSDMQLIIIEEIFQIISL